MAKPTAVSPSDGRDGTRESFARRILRGIHKFIVPVDDPVVEILGWDDSHFMMIQQGSLAIGGHVTRRREIVARVLQSNLIHSLIGFCIVCSFGLVIRQTDVQAADESVEPWLIALDNVVLGIFTIELSARLYCARWCFFRSFFNVLDFIIVPVDIIFAVISAAFEIDAISLSIFRIARLARLIRAYRVLMWLPMLSGMVKDLIGAFQAVFWGCCLLFSFLTVSSVLAVRFIHPLVQELAKDGVYDGCSRCPRAFSTVMQANLTFFQQIIAGDSWGQVTVPLIEHHPWTCILFFPVLIFVSLLIINVILAVIVESAQEARRCDVQANLKAKHMQLHKSSKRFMKLCQTIDEDSSGDITLEELKAGFNDNPELGMVLRDMGIGKPDLATIFEIMDQDHSGSVDYKEFIEVVYKMQTADEHTILNFIRHYVVLILRNLRACSNPEPALAEARSAEFSAVPVPGARVADGAEAKPGNSISVLPPTNGCDVSACNAPLMDAVSVLRQLCDQMFGRVDSGLLQAIHGVSQQCENQISVLHGIIQCQEHVAMQLQEVHGLVANASGTRQRSIPNLLQTVPFQQANHCTSIFGPCTPARARAETRSSLPSGIGTRTSPRHPQGPSTEQCEKGV